MIYISNFKNTNLPKWIWTIWVAILIFSFQNTYAQKVKKTQIKALSSKKVVQKKASKINTKPKNDAQKQLIKYGEQLIANTAYYLGPKGKVAKNTNGMNCQNCHLDAGTKFWGNNYFGVASTYPKYRERSGTSENIVKRVNDCMERSLNGRGLDSASREMRAIVSYIKYIGKNIPKDSIPPGTGLWKLPYLDRAADPSLGKIAYEQKCVVCHQINGEGTLNANKISYLYPPLWGPNSYNSGAGLFRLSRMAGYIKTNMPLGATHLEPQLTDEEAWDIAAYINSQPRPSKDLTADWPRIAGKPIDHPFGPYADIFTETEHKYGPFKPIEAYIKAKKKEQVDKQKLK